MTEDWLKFIVMLPVIGGTIYYFGRIVLAPGPMPDAKEFVQLSGFSFSLFYIAIPLLIITAILKYTVGTAYNDRFTFLVLTSILQVVLIPSLGASHIPMRNSRALEGYNPLESKARKETYMRKVALCFSSTIILSPLAVLLQEASPNYIFLAFELLTAGIGLSFVALSVGILNATYPPVKIIFKDNQVLEGILVKTGSEVVVWKTEGEIIHNYRINSSELKYIQSSHLLSQVSLIKKEAKP